MYNLQKNEKPSSNIGEFLLNGEYQIKLTYETVIYAKLKVWITIMTGDTWLNKK